MFSLDMDLMPRAQPRSAIFAHGPHFTNAAFTDPPTPCHNHHSTTQLASRLPEWTKNSGFHVRAAEEVVGTGRRCVTFRQFPPPLGSSSTRPGRETAKRILMPLRRGTRPHENGCMQAAGSRTKANTDE